MAPKSVPVKEGFQHVEVDYGKTEWWKGQPVSLAEARLRSGLASMQFRQDSTCLRLR